jgi:YbbR domain-containing protein
VTEQTSAIILDRETIQVAGNEAVLDSLNEIVLGTLDLSDILESTTMTYPIVLPEDVTNITNVTEVNVSINFPDLQIRKFKVSNFVAEKLPDGLEAQWLTDSLTVHLRGAKEVLDKLGAEDISVVVNFTGAEVGNQVYSAVIMVNTTGVVGAIGTYEVYVSVRVYVPQADLDLSYGTGS